MQCIKRSVLFILAKPFTLNVALAILITFTFGVMFFYYEQNQNPNSTLMETLRRIQFPSRSLDCQDKVDQIVVRVEDLIKGEPIKLLQNSPKLVHYVKTHEYLHPPSTLPYNLSNPKGDPSMGQSIMVKRLLNSKKNGFFVECGALDGETRSNSLMFEKDLGWKGLLIEADPKNFKLLIEKRRKAWSANVCLAIRPVPHEVNFNQDFNLGKIQQTHVSKQSSNTLTRAQCFPFYTLVSALNVSTVDYFSLDVEGDELSVLKTIPFDLVFIKILSVEFYHIKGGHKALKAFMVEKGYFVAGVVTHPHSLANDLIFAHKSLKYKTEKLKPNKYTTSNNKRILP